MKFNEMTPHEQIDHLLALSAIWAVIGTLFLVGFATYLPDLFYPQVRPRWVTSASLLCLLIGMILIGIVIHGWVMQMIAIDKALQNPPSSLTEDVKPEPPKEDLGDPFESTFWR